MADVYLAVTGTAMGFSKLQVLKVLKPDLEEQEKADFLQMFEDESTLTARLNHPNIVQSHEVGCDQGHHFIVMEYLDGQPLNRVLSRSWANRSPIPLELLLSVLCQVLDGLDYAHNLKDYDGTPLHIVHRDVSPHNIFVTYTGHAKLVDFGIAKTFGSAKTRAGIVKGKLPYMAPEQASGGAVDHRTDLFSVGVILWEMIAGRRMHSDQNMQEILRRLDEGRLPGIREVVTDVPEPIERIVTRALSKSVAERYPDARTFRSELLSLGQTRSVDLRDIGQHVTALFAQERSTLDEVIRSTMVPSWERSLGRVEAAAEPPSLGAAPIDLGRQATTRYPLSAPEEPIVSDTATRVVEAAKSTAPVVHAGARTTNAGLSKRARALLPYVLTLCAGGGAAMALYAGSPGNAPEAHATEGPATPLGIASVDASARGDVPSARAVTQLAVAPSSQGPATPATVRLCIAAEPKGATLVLDGTGLNANPYEGSRPRDTASHTLQVGAPGYSARSVPLSFERDVDLTLRLVEMNSKPPPLATSPRRTGSPRTPGDDSYMVDLPAPRQSSPTPKRQRYPTQ